MLIGVSILQKGTSNGTITDMDGNYTLKVSGEQPVLVFSYIGYKTLEIPGNKPTLNVTMSDDTQVIDEVVVTALGIKREKKMLGLRFVVIPPYQTITNLYGLSMVCLSATTTVLTLLTMAV